MLFHWYSSAILNKEPMLKIGQEAYLYHQVMANDHIIANSRITLIVINNKALQYNIAAGKLWNKNGTLTSCVLQYGPLEVLYSTLLERILRS